jgi:hypothetical protein
MENFRVFLTATITSIYWSKIYKSGAAPLLAHQLAARLRCDWPTLGQGLTGQSKLSRKNVRGKCFEGFFKDRYDLDYF